MRDLAICLGCLGEGGQRRPLVFERDPREDDSDDYLVCETCGDRIHLSEFRGSGTRKRRWDEPGRGLIPKDTIPLVAFALIRCPVCPAATPSAKGPPPKLGKGNPWWKMPLNHPPWWKTTVTGGLVLIAGRAEYLDGKGPEPAPDKQSGPRPTRAFL